MSAFFDPPSVTARTDSERIAQIVSYLYRLVGQLNLSNVGSESAASQTVVSTKYGFLPDISSDSQKAADLYGEIKSTIIRSAEFSSSVTGIISTELAGSYVAKSALGQYLESMKLGITATAGGISQFYSYSSNLRSDYANFNVESQSYIKTGLLYYNDAQPVFGVGIGRLSAETDGSGHSAIDRAQTSLTVTDGEIAFWGGGSRLAYITSDKVYFPSGRLVAQGADISGRITATEGSIGGLVIGDGFVRSSQGVYGSYSYTTSGGSTQTVDGWLFTVIGSRGFYYTVRSENDAASEVLATFETVNKFVEVSYEIDT